MTPQVHITRATGEDNSGHSETDVSCKRSPKAVPPFAWTQALSATLTTLQLLVPSPHLHV